MVFNISVVAAGLALLTTLLFLYFRRAFSYWKNRGIPYLEPVIPFGNLKSFSESVHLAQFIQSLYEKYKGIHKYFGLYFYTWPVVILTDLELIKTILVKDFQYFTDRQMYHNERDDPLSVHLVTLTGQKWKSVRAKLTPTFTSGKMKYMFPTIVGVSDRLNDYLRQATKTSNEFELKDILSRFTIDVIGECAFGIECNSLKEPDNEFRRMSRKITEIPRYSRHIVFLLNYMQRLGNFLRIKILRDDVTSFFMNVVRSTVKYREENNVQRNDFMNLLIKIKQESGPDGGFTIEEIAAQAFVFFVAGFETSALTMIYTLYELSLNPDIQTKVRTEIQTVLKKHDGNFTYEAMMEMTYLDQIITETLRKYPPVTMLRRIAVSDYQVPDTNHIIEKGTEVFTPVYAIHHDSEYFPNPEKFDPERFSAAENEKRDPFTSLTFGEGPRKCIAFRFGKMQSRVGLVTLLKNFEFGQSHKTTIPLVFLPLPSILVPKGGVYLEVKPLDENWC